MLVEWDGLSIAEAAVVLGVPGTTVTKRLHSAREVFAKNYSVIEEREK
jgi:DNA-directed RNA polymerase specialized sigma24 family protein